MSHVFFRYFRIKKSKQEIELLMILSKYVTISIQSLAKSSGVSSRSVINDLHFLEQSSNHKIKINRSKSGYVSLIWKQDYPIEEMIASLVKDTLSHRLIDGIFCGLKMSIDGWAEYLYASKVTIYRNI